MQTGTYGYKKYTFSICTAYDSAKDEWYDRFADNRGGSNSITVDSVEGKTLTGTFEAKLVGYDLNDASNLTAGMPDIIITNGRFHYMHGKKHDVIKNWKKSKTNSGDGNSNKGNPDVSDNFDEGSSNDKHTCGTCRGTGKINCTYCSGKGYTEKTYMPPFGEKVEIIQTRCTHCNQTGREYCYVCKGKGWW